MEQYAGTDELLEALAGPQGGGEAGQRRFCQVSRQFACTEPQEKFVQPNLMMAHSMRAFGGAGRTETSGYDLAAATKGEGNHKAQPCSRQKRLAASRHSPRQRARRMRATVSVSGLWIDQPTASSGSTNPLYGTISG